MPYDIHDIAGIFGAGLYLGSYGALQTGLLTNRGYLYPALNLGAASLMLVSLMGSFNPWSATIETCWVLFSIIGLMRYYFLTSGLTLAPEERQLLDAKFPGLEPYLARRLFAAGRWEIVGPGTTLAREGEDVEALVYLSGGHASVTLGGREVGECRDGSLIGELGATSKLPAIATVTVTVSSRVFVIPAPVLRELMTKTPEIRIALDAWIGSEARAKLIASNARLSAAMPA